MTGFKPGDRVHEWGNAHTPATTGTVRGIDSTGRILVLWDDGPVITPNLPQNLEPLGEPMSTETDFFAEPGSHNPETMTFKSVAEGSNATFLVVRSGAGIGLAINSTMSVIDLANEDAPSVALAILEAAGVEPTPFDEGPESTPGHAAWVLRHHVQETEAAAKEAADREALEDEAWDFANAHGGGASGYASFGHLAPRTQERWLNVARKARELRGGTA